MICAKFIIGFTAIFKRLTPVAGLVDELEIVEQVNQHLGEDLRGQNSPRIVVKAMILNSLGLVSAPLYVFEQFS